MKNSEAISKIRFMLDVGGSDGFTSADEEALNMAINALTAEISEKPKSNADKIRAMDDEELADMLDIYDVEDVCEYCSRHNTVCHNHCYEGILEWLRKEADEDAGTD